MKTIILAVDREHPDESVIRQAGEILKNGGLVAFPDVYKRQITSCLSVGSAVWQNKDAGISFILYTMKRRYVKRFILFSYMWKKLKI